MSADSQWREGPRPRGSAWASARAASPAQARAMTATPATASVGAESRRLAGPEPGDGGPRALVSGCEFKSAAWTLTGHHRHGAVFLGHQLEDGVCPPAHLSPHIITLHRPQLALPGSPPRPGTTLRGVASLRLPWRPPGTSLPGRGGARLPASPFCSSPFHVFD